MGFLMISGGIEVTNTLEEVFFIKVASLLGET